LNLPGVYAVLDAGVAAAHGWTVPDLARAVLSGGARLLQIRAKQLDSAALLALTREVVAAARPWAARVVVNDRADLAVLGGADGVHVGQDDLAPDQARAIVGPDALVGVSTHTGAQIAGAQRSPADYIAVGPVFGTLTKDTGYDAVGVALIGTARAAGLPVVAIGGITLERVPAAVEAGATSLAIVSDLLTGNDPAARTRAFVEAVAAAKGRL
jgi:thiamine-phosphate pyrophosphorylase